MGTLSRSWELVQKSFGVLLSDKELLFLPIASGISCAVVSLMFVSATALVFRPQIAAISRTVGTRPSMTQGMWAALRVFYLINYLVVVFFNVALVAAASDHFAGGKATVDRGLQVAWERKGSIFQWALLAATVGLILNMIEDRRAWVGNLAARFIGVAWSIATFFVMPIIAVEGIGPVEALYRSSDLVSETWGEELAGGFSFGLIFALFAMPCLILPIVLVKSIGREGLLIGMIVAVSYLLLLSIISSAVRGIFMAALYRYAIAKEIPSSYNREDFATAWRPRD